MYKFRGIFFCCENRNGGKIFPRLTITVGPAIYAWPRTCVCVCVCRFANIFILFYFIFLRPSYGLYAAERRNFETNLAAESRTAREIQGKGWAKGKCDEAKIKSTRGTNKTGRKGTGGSDGEKDVSSRVSLT